MALFQFYATDPQGNPTRGDRIKLISRINKALYSGRPDKNGRFDLLLPKGDSLELSISSLGKDSVLRLLVIPNDSDKLRIYTYKLSYSPPRTIILKNVFYDTGKASLRPESFPSLDELVDLLKSKPNIEMEIYGHTDNEGGYEYNMKLSQGRAESVKKYLIEHGIAAGRLTAVGYGYTKPIDSNQTPEGRQNNRRTEVRILY
jgi:outer membrane protein OmpA-like peptidoglycan-associated protein